MMEHAADGTRWLASMDTGCTLQYYWCFVDWLQQCDLNSNNACLTSILHLESHWVNW